MRALQLAFPAALVLAVSASCGDDGTDFVDATVDAPGLDASADVARDANGSDAAADAASDAAPDAAPVDADPPPARTRVMYVAVGSESRLAQVDLNPDGSLRSNTSRDVTLPGRPGAMTYDAETDRIYVGVRSSGGSIVTLAVDENEDLTVLGGTENTGFPVYLDTIRAGRFVVSTYFGGDVLKVHDAMGMPPHLETGDVATDDEPHQCLTSPDGARVYVPSRNGASIAWFSVSEAGVPAEVDSLDVPGAVGPRHLTMDRSGARAYLIQEFGDAVQRYDVGTNGALTPVGEALTTLPASHPGDENSGADVHLSRDGRFVYASNRDLGGQDRDSIAAFAVGADGSLSPNGRVDTETIPREFAMEPSGRYVVVAGQRSGILESFAIQDDGSLTSIDTERVGDDLRWIIIL